MEYSLKYNSGRNWLDRDCGCVDCKLSGLYWLLLYCAEMAARYSGLAGYLTKRTYISGYLLPGMVDAACYLVQWIELANCLLVWAT